MKKVLLVVLLMLGMAVLLHAQEYDNGDNHGDGSGTNESSADKEKKSGLGGHVRVGYSFPFLAGFMEREPGEDRTAGEAFVTNLVKFGLALGFSSLAVGGGVQYDVVPHLFCPGLYLDANFNLLSWGIMALFDRKFIMFQFGFRVFNQFSLSWFAVEPFFGGNVVYLNYEGSGIPIFFLQGGFVMNLGKFSFEYGYHFPTKKIGIEEDFSFKGIHRITFSGIVFKR